MLLPSPCLLFSSIFVSGLIITGDWGGSLKVSSSSSLPLEIHVNDSTKEITFDSPSQGAFGIPCETLVLTDDSISFKIPQIGLSYCGKLKSDEINGVFKQGFMSLPLVFQVKEGNIKRPQTPSDSVSYSCRDVEIQNPAGGVLSGTLTMPADVDKDTPIVILLTGSGLQNRDEELYGHKPFAVISDYLARNGIASFRYDDRGFGKSSGDSSHSTTLDFAEDARTVLQWIKDNCQFEKIGIIGHSEGGLISYILANAENHPDFIVSIAGPAIDGFSIIKSQVLNRLSVLNTLSESELAAFSKAMDNVGEFRKINNRTITDEVIKELYPDADNSAVTSQLKEVIRTYAGKNENVWLEYFLNYDPANDLEKIKIPAFLIYGEKDTQVPGKLNSELAQQYLKNATVRLYPSLNHLMQHAQTGLVEEYYSIEETFAEEVLKDIVDFIKTL